MKKFLLNLLQRIKQKLDIDLNDWFTFGGLAAAGYGIAQIHVPSAWIVVGTVLFLIGVRR